MTDVTKADVCIIGAGSGGLSVAAGIAQLGLKTILVEKSEMGGDCLNTGCVPSKALLAAARRAQMQRKSNIKGIASHEPQIDFSAVKDHVFDTIKAIEPNDSQKRFEGLGVIVVRASAHFIGPDTVMAGDSTFKARYFVIATGSSAVVPAIKGLEKSKVFTNETVFSLREKPEHLLIIGGGPIGIEMAQAHRRLGCKVTVIDMGQILSIDDQQNVRVIQKILENEGVTFYECASINEIIHVSSGLIVKIVKDGKRFDINVTHVLVATGRKPNTDGLGLEAAGVCYNSKGIKVDARLRTSNKKVFAIGDVSGGPQFTHVASYHAGIIIRNVCFKIPAKVDYKALSWVTYTDPELAQVGLTEVQAIEKQGENVKVVEWSYDENDRAIAERITKGQIRVVTNKRGLILGASIVGAQAGELIGLWQLAISSGLKIGAVASMITPYPTLGEISKRAAGAWYTTSLFSRKTRCIVSFLQKLPF